MYLNKTNLCQYSILYFPNEAISEFLYDCYYGNHVFTPGHTEAVRIPLLDVQERQIPQADLPLVIDFGSSNTTMGICLPDGSMRIATAKGKTIIPSVIGVPQAGFAAACESVYYGKSDACLLPVENARDGFLHSFARLVAEYELCCTMRIELTDEEDAVHAFALYRTEYGCPAVDAPICMEFSAKASDRRR